MESAHAETVIASMVSRTYRKPASRARSRSVRESNSAYSESPAVWRAVDAPHRTTPLLMDTHVWLWILHATPGVLSDTVRKVIERAAETHRLFVSDISYWEVALLVSKGRFDFAQDFEHFISTSEQAPGISYASVGRDVFVASTKLPGEPHNDPADRILIAHARALGASLLTRDKNIINYAKRTPGIPVCDARG